VCIAAVNLKVSQSRFNVDFKNRWIAQSLGIEQRKFDQKQF